MVMTLICSIIYSYIGTIDELLIIIFVFLLLCLQIVYNSTGLSSAVIYRLFIPFYSINHILTRFSFILDSYFLSILYNINEEGGYVERQIKQYNEYTFATLAFSLLSLVGSLLGVLNAIALITTYRPL